MVGSELNRTRGKRGWGKGGVGGETRGEFLFLREFFSRSLLSDRLEQANIFHFKAFPSTFLFNEHTVCFIAERQDYLWRWGREERSRKAFSR